MWWQPGTGDALRQSSFTRETFQALKMSKKLTIFVDGPYGIAEGKIIWMVEKDIVFWCREELRLGSRPRARVDVGTGEQADIEIHVREHLVPEITQIPKGYVFVGRYSMVSKADEPALYRVLRRINPSMGGTGESSSSISYDSSLNVRDTRTSQSFDSSPGLQGKDSQELMLWHLGRKKTRSKKSTGVRGVQGDESADLSSPRRGSRTERLEPEVQEPTDPAERMRVAREALKETATDRRPLFDSQDDIPSSDVQEDDPGSSSYSSQELRAPAKRVSGTRGYGTVGKKAPPRKSVAHRALKDSVEVLRARTTEEVAPIKKKATESSTFGFKRDFTTKKKRRKRRPAAPLQQLETQDFSTYVEGIIAPGTASALVTFDDVGKLLACMRKTGDKLWFSICLSQPCVVNSPLELLLKLPDSTMTQLQGKVTEIHSTHSVVAVERARPHQIDAIRAILNLD